MNDCHIGYHSTKLVAIHYPICDHHTGYQQATEMTESAFAMTVLRLFLIPVDCRVRLPDFSTSLQLRQLDTNSVFRDESHFQLYPDYWCIFVA
ncbi:hypothetical protein AVEN_143669-1 [Araneus ventricosus]|uniref:Uncharacterized protein n=1 Tax=Araneus ventricosus TaxID=182803 RepID=A0A4Y2AQA0_ARAVE|nr:hypothetical protein AVEN_143669-1 [Araneus ventricosus]